MSTPRSSDITLTTLMEPGGSVTTPLDAAADYWRYHFANLLPMYVLAMAPHAVLISLFISAITGEQRSLVERYCIYLSIATVWRWVWIARLQHGVQQNLRAQKQPIFWSRLPQILLVRLFGNVAINWGLILAFVPAFYGFYIGSFAAPLLLESDEPAVRRVRQSIKWVHHSSKRLFQISLSLTVLTGLLVVAVFVGQSILAHTVLPTLLGIDTTELDLTFGSWSWRLSLLYFIFLIVDAFWSVAAVLVYYDSQSRRTASDLHARLMALTEGAA